MILFVLDEDFDPVEIADKLRSVADALNDDVNFRAALTDLKKAAAKEVTERERETHAHTHTHTHTHTHVYLSVAFSGSHALFHIYG